MALAKRIAGSLHERIAQRLIVPGPPRLKQAITGMMGPAESW